MGLNFLRDYVIIREGTGLKVVYKEKIRGLEHEESKVVSPDYYY